MTQTEAPTMSREKLKAAFNLAFADGKDYLLVIRHGTTPEERTETARGIRAEQAAAQLLKLMRRYDGMEIASVYPLKGTFERTRPGDARMLPAGALEQAQADYAAGPSGP